MGKRDYSTTRNRPIIIKNPVVTFKLKASDIIILQEKVIKFNDWELSFYNTLKQSSYNIVSDKQWEVVKNLIAK